MPQHWEKRFIDYFENSQMQQEDAAHDLSHLMRVARSAYKIAKLESASIDPLVIIAAAYLHDLINLPKNHPERHLSSYYAAQKAGELLENMLFPKEKIADVCHAIHSHSYSANIEPKTLEAKILQDADRLEALGALGFMRVFYTSGKMGSLPYHTEDPLAENRELNDRLYGLDHFYCKLFKLPNLFQTEGGKTIAKERSIILQAFVNLWISDRILNQDISGANGVMECYYHAGIEGLEFFHPSDPFAVKRTFDPARYALDSIISVKSPKHFVHMFVHSLKQEIE